METYIVRQPIMDSKQKVAAYEILYQQDETSLYNQKDSTVANAIEQFLLQFCHGCPSLKQPPKAEGFILFRPDGI